MVKKLHVFSLKAVTREVCPISPQEKNERNKRHSDYNRRNKNAYTNRQYGFQLIKSQSLHKYKTKTNKFSISIGYRVN